MGNCIHSQCVSGTKKPSGLIPKPKPPLPKPKPQNNTTSAGNEVDPGCLKVQAVDLCFATNGPSHHTEDYDLMEKLVTVGGRLVVRRGQPFTIKVTFDRAFKSGMDNLSLVFTYKACDSPSYGHGTMILIPLQGQHEVVPDGNWTARTHAVDGNTVTIEITSSADAIVGQWILDIDCRTGHIGTACNYEYPHPIYIIFNPWCPDDTSFLDDESHRKEYVMSDWGLIWRGSHNRLRPCVWTYGQFELDILDCSLYLLQNIRRLKPKAMADSVTVSRAISTAVNSPDDNGALVGNWSGDYAGGQAPTHWVGSIKILQQFYKTKKPVKYGQCWVFSGVVTTVCRALGLPARSVTNFSSAHDTQCSMTIDYFFKEGGEAMEDMNTDSIWNFHVWNEVWMSRPDLEPGDYGGWQAIDATPQEYSDGLYRCGPASVKALRRGEVKKPFDGEFIFAEVNADEVYWRYAGPTQPMKYINKRADTVGKHISTKAIGSNQREDLTLTYKPMEKSKEERTAMLRALRQCGNMFSRYYLNDEMEDVEFEFRLRDDIMIGQPFSIVLYVQNKNLHKDYNIQAVLRASTVMYTGKPHKTIKTQNHDVKILKNSAQELCMNISYEEYYPQLTEQAAISLVTVAKVNETNFEYFAHDDFRVRKPDIKIEALPNATAVVDSNGSGLIFMESNSLTASVAHLKVGETFTVKAQFTNPLPIPLTRGQFHFEGPGLGEPLSIKCDGPVEAGGEATATCSMKPRLAGEKTIGISFESKELDDVDGYLTVQVKPREHQPE